MHPNFSAYHKEAELVALRHMSPLPYHPARQNIPGPRYPQFLNELEPIWRKHFGLNSWPKIWVGGQ